jgi:hypothetical protein
MNTQDIIKIRSKILFLLYDLSEANENEYVNPEIIRDKLSIPQKDLEKHLSYLLSERLIGADIRDYYHITHEGIKKVENKNAVSDDSEVQNQILRYIRTNPYRMSINKIYLRLGLPKETVITSINNLLETGLIIQDKRDNVDWNNEWATYFTVPSKRKDIDKLIGVENKGNIPPERLLGVFLCHSKDDKEIVRSLYNRLISETFIAPWLDEINLLAGQDWQFEIPRAIRESDIVVVSISSTAVNREGYFQKEIARALDVAEEKPQGAIYIIPLKLEECIVPDRLSRWQWIDYFKEDGYEKLLQTLRYRADKLGLINLPLI